MNQPCAFCGGTFNMLKKEVGIVKGYPRISRRFGKLTAWIQLLRPFTLVAPFAAGLFGVLAPVNEIAFEHVVTAIYVGVTLALAQACGQCLNQYVDVELDKIIKPYRPLPSGLITREEALGLAWLLALFSIARAFTINTFFGLTTLTLIFFAVFYSMSPFSPRRVHPLLNTGWMAFSRGFLPMLATLTVYGNLNMAWPYSVLAFLWVLSLQGTKDVKDSEADRKFGIKTIPNMYGVRGFLVYAAIVKAAMYLYAVLYLPHMLVLTPLSITALLGLNRQLKGMENNLSWICFYLGISAIYLLIFLTSRL